MQIVSKQAHVFVLGLALFSMFFGSGNLIFPLFIGQIADNQWMMAAMGFLIAAVLIPLSGVIAMVVYEGNYTRFFEVVGRPLGFALTAALLTVWIPLGSGPRCISLGYASMLPYFTMPPEWLFSIFYSALVFMVAWQKQRMLRILGYFLTPLLLLCLAIIVFGGLPTTSMAMSEENPLQHFVKGIVEGYNTMDLIASFFFSASIIAILKQNDLPPSAAISTVLRASLVAMVVLASVYLGLIYLAAGHTSLLENVPKEQLLAHVAKAILGPNLGIVASAAILLACFSTSVALVNVFADFLTKSLFKSPGKHVYSLLITLFGCFAMSIFGLKGVTAVTAPILQVLYPLLIALIIFNVGRYAFTRATAPQRIN